VNHLTHSATEMRDTDCKLVDGRRQKPAAKTFDSICQNALEGHAEDAPLALTPHHAQAATAYLHGRACSTLRVHAKLAMASCPDDSLDIWPVTGSAVTSVTVRRPLGKEKVRAARVAARRGSGT